MATEIDAPTIVDDSGAGLDGTVGDAAWVADLCDRINEMFNGTLPFYLGGALGLGRYTTTATGTQNDWDIDAANSNTSVGILRCNNASALTINGIVAPTGHRVLMVLPVNSSVVLAHEAGGSSAANRIVTQGAANVTLASGGFAVLLYDVTSARWRLVAFGVIPTGSTTTFLRGDGSWATPDGGLFTEQTTSSTGAQHNFDLNAKLTFLRCTGAAPSFSGFTVLGSAPTAGCRVIIHCIGSTSAKVTNQDTNSTAANRIISPSSTGQIVGVNGTIELIYDDTTDRWRVDDVHPGQPISVAFSAGNFTASAGDWTLTSPDQIVYRYQQEGTRVFFEFNFSNTTVSSTPSGLRVEIASTTGFTVSGRAFLVMRVDDNGTVAIAQADFNSAVTYVQFSKTSGNWATSTDNTVVAGNFFVTVQ